MPTPSVTTVGNAIVALLQTITYLQGVNGGLIQLAADPKPLIDLSTLPPPFVVIVPAHETPRGENLNLGGAVFETFMHWEFYFGSSSFALTGEGLTGSVVGDPGFNQMIDDIHAACNGKIVSSNPASKLFPSSPFWRRYDLTANSIVGQMNWRNQWQRIGT